MRSTTKETISKLCSYLVVEMHDNAPIPFIVTPMSYPNGDSINLYFRESGRHTIVSDEGTTIENIAGSMTGLADDRLKIIEMICKRTGIELDGAKLSKKLRAKTPSEDCLSLCQAIATVSGLYYQQEQHERSRLPSDIETVLQKKVLPKREYVKNWKDTQHDPAGSFLVDYHFNGSLPPRNLFYVTTGGKALLVTAVVHFLRSHGYNAQTLTVVDKDADVKGKQIDRLRFASDDILFGLKGHEKNVVQFALGK